MFIASVTCQHDIKVFLQIDNTCFNNKQIIINLFLNMNSSPFMRVSYIYIVSIKFLITL